MTQLIATSQWNFFGTGDARPTLGLFAGQLRDLGPNVRIRERITEKGVLMGLEVAPPNRPLLSVAVHMNVATSSGELAIDFSVPDSAKLKRYRKLPLPGKSPASDITISAAITAIDRGQGRTYRDLVRPVLCVLGEFYPHGVVMRVSDGLVFPTRGMRRRMQTEPFDTCFIQGYWTFGPDVMDVVKQVVESNPNCRRMCSVNEQNVTFRAVEVLIPQSSRPALERDLASLARHATAGRVTMTFPDEKPLFFVSGENAS